MLSAIYEAVIFDLDGTAIPVGSQAKPSAKLCRAIKKQRGAIRLSIATGRMWEDVRILIKHLGIIEPCIVNGGASIISPVNDEVLWQVDIPTAQAKSMLEITKAYPYKVWCTQGLISSGEVLPGLANISNPISVFYVLDIPLGKSLDTLVQALMAVPDITITQPPSWRLADAVDLNITHAQATKEHGILELCDILGVNRLNVTGVGDGHNDLHMFKAVGHKVAMGNAITELKEAADIVIGRVEDDGLADFISSL
jgi:hydroxymethylpyrimidine pyrophosphatase-like HAD family hydrolase